MAVSMDLVHAAARASDELSTVLHPEFQRHTSIRPDTIHDGEVLDLPCLRRNIMRQSYSSIGALRDDITVMCHRALARHSASLDNCEFIGELQTLAFQLLDQVEQECVERARKTRKSVDKAKPPSHTNRDEYQQQSQHHTTQLGIQSTSNT